MKTKALLYLVCIGLLVNNTVFSQSGESKFKMVVVNPNERKIAPLFPSFKINDMSFTDSDMNRQIDGKEDGSIKFYIKNTGTIVLKELIVTLNIPDSIKGLSYGKIHTVNQINLGDSTMLSIPLKGDEKIKDGLAPFEIIVKDANSDTVRMAHLVIPTKQPLTAPIFTWMTPSEPVEKASFSVVDISGVVKTKSNITGLKVYINGQVPNDSKSFEVLATENPEEYRIARRITLDEGDNEIKIEAKNAAGTTISESKIINYFVQKIDQNYVEKRLALVIGNADYLNSNPLQNPLNDARAISAALKSVGFTVMTSLNADQKTMDKVMDEFGEKLKAYNVGLFYYAGHGMQVNGNNYLIPIDAVLKVEQDVRYDCVDAGRLLGKMEAAGTSTNIIILDACRDNPFARSWGSRSAGQGSGLAFMDAPSGSIVAYATAPGKTASDGTGKNGLYTEAFLKYIDVPNLSLLEFFQDVRAEVIMKSGKTQTPWEATSLNGNFYFKIK